jgi:tetratricopeptide (TPR) repeat protein
MPEAPVPVEERIGDSPPQEPPQQGPLRAEETPREFPIHGRHVLAGLALLAAVIAAIAIATSGGSDSPAPSDSIEPAAEEPAAEEPAPSEPADVATSGAVPEPKPNADPAKGAAYEGQAFEQLASDPEGAIRTYEKALAQFPAETRTPEAFAQYPEYAYALYSYADALLQVGRADEAVDVLEQRLAFDDQRETVEALLAEAQAAAGE